MDSALRPVWGKLLKFDWKFGLVLLLVVCIVRFLLVLKANVENDYSAISWIMIFSAVVPFIFLSRTGRRSIGMVRAQKVSWLFYSFFIGIVLALILYIAGYLLYSYTIENWYIYIGNSYSIPEGISGKDKFIYFCVFAITGMIFSPIGEELFFRGIIHGSFATTFGDKRASLIDSLTFALTHLSHFGLIYIAGVWRFIFLPSLIWMSGMFILGIIFYQCKKKSGSLLGAIVCHAGFNLGMIFCIFYLLN